ncbi:hypothetical protein [Lederbergia citrea]|uniref:Uncharacterized protein n=1 Tax=Lederbergia citrea TaxID=2833581 RepID=A0A942UP67_9BACI|nr:hypothetical protein [Lederbergia citrea]MBS4178490.1 hypothetical protein [Lederbergia citrea]MBS4205161.1 hypothetical protein [Lederbergia citrea]MBS4222977.1 hypothetical protein [Lederbergia citrea]
MEDFIVTREVFEHLPHGKIHFELTIEGKDYEGQYHYANGKITWFNPQPKSEDHDASIDAVEKKIKKIMIKQDYPH